MTFTLSDEQYKNLCTNFNKLLDKLHKALKDREEYKKQRDELIGDIAEVKRKAKAFDEIDNLIYEVFEMMNCFKFSFINENKELILDSESNIFFSLKDCANKLDLVVKFIHWVSRSCIENMGSVAKLNL